MLCLAQFPRMSKATTGIGGQDKRKPTERSYTRDGTYSTKCRGGCGARGHEC